MKVSARKISLRCCSRICVVYRCFSAVPERCIQMKVCSLSLMSVDDIWSVHYDSPSWENYRLLKCDGQDQISFGKSAFFINTFIFKCICCVHFSSECVFPVYRQQPLLPLLKVQSHCFRKCGILTNLLCQVSKLWLDSGPEATRCRKMCLWVTQMVHAEKKILSYCSKLWCTLLELTDKTILRTGLACELGHIS